MKSGTEKNHSPHESSLGAFLRSREYPLRMRDLFGIRYVKLRNGQVLRRETWEQSK